MKAELFYKADARLGESPVYIEQSNELMWVDILNKKLHFNHLNNKKHEEHQLNQYIGFASIDSRGNYWLGLSDGLYRFDREKQTLQLNQYIENNIPDNRFNDGKIGPDGAIYAGTMDLNAQKNKGTLYRIDTSGKHTSLIENVSISNGMAWSKNHDIFYYIDSASYYVRAYEYNHNSGSICKPKIVIRVPKEHGIPDGMCLNPDGNLWIAHWGGSNVSLWNTETGQCMEKILLPAPHVTSCCLDSSNNLYISTAREGLNQNECKDFPLSGSIFSISVDHLYQ